MTEKNQYLPQWTSELTKTFIVGEDQLGVDGAAVSYQQWLFLVSYPLPKEPGTTVSMPGFCIVTSIGKTQLA